MNVLGTALSALLGQSRSVATSANNIANTTTTGFKAERTDFATANPESGGVRTFQTRLIDQQGPAFQTSENLDTAINGNGFFVVEDGQGGQAFTRDGSFSPDANGDLRNAAGSRLLGFAEGGGELQPVNIGEGGIGANVTSEIEFQANLDARSDPAETGVDFSRNVDVFDSAGADQTLSFDFEASGTNQFDFTARDENGVTLGTQTLEFDTGGQLTTPADGQIELTGIDFGNGSEAQDITVDLSGTTQFSSSFAVQNVDQNGFGPGNLSSVSIGGDGQVSAQFSNGASEEIAQVPLATFASPAGLQPASNNRFLETRDSGEANINIPGQGGAGTLNPASLEGSNVSLTSETANIIQADVAFRAALSTIRAEEEQFESLLDITS